MRVLEMQKPLHKTGRQTKLTSLTRLDKRLLQKRRRRPTSDSKNCTSTNLYRKPKTWCKCSLIMKTTSLVRWCSVTYLIHWARDWCHSLANRKRWLVISTQDPPISRSAKMTRFKSMLMLPGSAAIMNQQWSTKRYKNNGITSRKNPWGKL